MAMGELQHAEFFFEEHDIIFARGSSEHGVFEKISELYRKAAAIVGITKKPFHGSESAGH